MANDIVTQAPTKTESVPTLHAPPIPEIPRAVDPALINFLNQQIDRRVYDTVATLTEMAVKEANEKSYKRRMMTYGAIGVAGAVVGVGTVLIVQRIRAGRADSME